MAEFLGLMGVVGIGVVGGNTRAMFISRRRNQIAVMRSIGFPSGVVLSLLVGESLIIACSGGAIGCGWAFGLFKVLEYIVEAIGPLVTLHVPPFGSVESLELLALMCLSLARFRVL